MALMLVRAVPAGPGARVGRVLRILYLTSRVLGRFFFCPHRCWQRPRRLHLRGHPGSTHRAPPVP
eukprot:3710102-Prymnesium_polylepis.1